MKVKNYLAANLDELNSAHEQLFYTNRLLQFDTPTKHRTTDEKYIAPGKKVKEKKPDYSQQRKQKRGE